MRLPMNNSAGLMALAALAVQGLCVSAALAQKPDDLNYSVMARLAPESLLLDGVRAGDQLVVVGARGHLLISGDDGGSWQQVVVPTRATLTAVFFIDAQNGWAVGHDAVIIRTRDAGGTWERVHFAPEEERPLLDVWFEDDQHGFAVGAYGYFLETFDGGDTWENRLFEVTSDEDETQSDAETGADALTPADMMAFLDDEDPISDLHLNDVSEAPDGSLYLAAEAGHIFRSEDAGASWRELTSPYEGSFYGSLVLADDGLLLFGLRGNIYYSADTGKSWQRVDAGTDAILMGAALAPDGRPLIAGLGGTLLAGNKASDGAAPEFKVVQQADRKALATILITASDQFVLIGENGVSRLDAIETAAGQTR